MKRLLKTLRFCGLLMSIGCQNTPPVTSEAEKVDTAQTETQPASTPEARQEPASNPRAATPASKQRRVQAALNA